MRRCRLVFFILLFAISFVALRIGLYFLWLYQFDLSKVLVDQTMLGQEIQADTPFRIPPIMHQTFKKDTPLPEAWERAHASCLHHHPDFTYRQWNDDSMRAFLVEHFPEHLENYDSYPYTIQRVDAFRYYVLLKEGGVYLDMDIGCRQSMTPLLKSFDLILPKTEPFGVSNDLMMTIPGHPFFKRLVFGLSGANHYYGTKYPTVMFSTGPAFVDNHLMNYLTEEKPSINKTLRFNKNLEQSTVHDKSGGVAIIDGNLYGAVYFYHVAGSSWHGSDAAFVLLLGNHLSSILVWACTSLFLIGMLFIFKVDRFVKLNLSKLKSRVSETIERTSLLDP